MLGENKGDIVVIIHMTVPFLSLCNKTAARIIVPSSTLVCKKRLFPSERKVTLSSGKTSSFAAFTIPTTVTGARKTGGAATKMLTATEMTKRTLAFIFIVNAFFLIVRNVSYCIKSIPAMQSQI
jgi:hypothetical protein